MVKTRPAKRRLKKHGPRSANPNSWSTVSEFPRAVGRSRKERLILLVRMARIPVADRPGASDFHFPRFRVFRFPVFLAGHAFRAVLHFHLHKTRGAAGPVRRLVRTPST